MPVVKLVYRALDAHAPVTFGGISVACTYIELKRAEESVLLFYRRMPEAMDTLPPLSVKEKANDAMTAAYTPNSRRTASSRGASPQRSHTASPTSNNFHLASALHPFSVETAASKQGVQDAETIISELRESVNALKTVRASMYIASERY